MYSVWILLFFSFASLVPVRFPGANLIAYHSDTLQPTKYYFGIASYYSDSFIGKKTANGEVFSQQKMTAANNRLPLGTIIRVTNLRNDRSVIVKVNDRLHRRNKRLVDLSRAAAKKLGFIQSGITRVKIEILTSDNPDR